MKARKLQWGRSLSTAEVANRTDGIRYSNTSFNGAAVIRLRKCDGNKGERPETQRLQWGRSLSTAEVAKDGLPIYKFKWASMGPQSFDCGSKGRKSSSHVPPIRFNGAAVFRLR